MSDFSLEDMKKLILNPFYCIDITNNLSGPHTKLVDKDTWVQSAIHAICEDDDGNTLGYDEKLRENLEAYLYRLLDILEGNYPTEDGVAPLGYIHE